MVNVAKSSIQKVSEIIEGSRSIWNLGHENPDGDTIGCAVALHHAVSQMGKSVHTFFAEPVPRMYSRFPGIECIEVVQKLPDELPELIIATDNATFARFGKKLVSELNRLGVFPAYDSRHNPQLTFMLNIDHHKDNELYGDFNLIDPEVSSVGEIILEVVKRLVNPVPRVSLEAVFGALITDTGRFSYANTNRGSFRAAEELVSLGVDVSKVVTAIYYTLTENDLKLLSLILQSLVVDEELGYCFAYVDLRMLEECQVELGDSEWVMDVLKLLKEPKVCVFFKQYGERFFRVSVRSRGGFDASVLARRFGGGGHPAAAGYTFEGSLEDVINSLRNAMSDLKESMI